MKPPFRSLSRGLSAQSGPLQPRLSRLGFLVGLAGGVVGSGLPIWAQSPVGPDATSLAAPAAAPVELRGDWGALRLRALRLMPADDLLADIVLPQAELWAFGSRSWTEIEALLDTLLLPPAVRAELRDPGRRSELASPDIERLLHPSAATRLALTPDQRAQLYRFLARHGRNAAHAVPFILPAETVLAAAPLSDAVRDRLARLTFTDGPDRYLVDFDLVLAAASDPAEAARLRRLLLSFPSFTGSFLRESLTERAAVEAYWSRPGTTSAARWTRTLERSPETSALDLAQLLPALPRRVLNAFPDGAAIPPDANCFWISLNFFRTETNDELLPFAEPTDRCAAVTRAELDRHYTRVEAPPYRYGDVLLFSDPRTAPAAPVHAVVYLAGDLVFTKNGWGPSSPFALGFLSAVDRRYNWAGQLTLEAYRPIPGSPALPLPTSR